jgi:hypothetical protein
MVYFEREVPKLLSLAIPSTLGEHGTFTHP